MSGGNRPGVNRFRVIVAACAIAVIAVLALLLSSGGHDATLVPGSALADAASATERVAGASTTVDGTVSAAALPEPLHIRLHGTQNTRQRAAHLAGVYENYPQKGTVPVDSITILPDIYLKSPIFAGTAIPSGKWLHIDLQKTGKQLGIGDPTQFGSGDPSQVVQTLRAVSSRVEQVGTEEVRGVRTTHYRGTVELRRLPQVVPPARRAAAKQSADRLIQLIGSDSYPLEVWVDRKRLVRRIRLKMTMKVQGRSLTQDMTIELFDFGPKRRIKPPPAGDTVEAPSASASTAGP
jgi:hypothetical protein